jgi:carbamoyl-phosphate synthase small subunit
MRVSHPWDGFFFAMKNKGYLILENGSSFEGTLNGEKGTFHGEVVFTTGMTGYYESLTDPSYAGQILTFTYPLIGNYGVASKNFWESKKIHAKGVVVCEEAQQWSHHASVSSFSEWLTEQEIPLLSGVDTRAITKILRNAGTMRGVISSQRDSTPFSEDLDSKELVAQVSVSEKQIYGKGPKRVIAVDCGMKENMLRSLLKFPIEILRVPYHYDYSQEDYDGVFLSNGPGDPIHCEKTIHILKKAILREKPIYGVCLGNQLLALASGAKTYKLKFGHRGQNQPCMDLETSRCYITSQNHSYAIHEETLPKEWKVTFRNLNDGSVEGIAHRSLPFYSVQFHPEACPGPTDTSWFFERFYSCL